MTLGPDDVDELKAIFSGREYCPRCGSGPRRLEDVDECPDCGRTWEGPPLLASPGAERR
jgi:ribosomal protein S27AE